MAERRLVSFDWALKKPLRAKANFDVLEGFLSELLHQDVQILEILESESNRETSGDKFNRVDLKTAIAGELVIVEIQYERQFDYFHRILYGAAKTVTEHMQAGAPYGEVRKVISIHILYFELGHGDDYIYHGKTEFTGLHRRDVLQLSAEQRQMFGKDAVYQVFPEYWLLKVNNFDDIARNSLDEWIYFLKNEQVQGTFPARGLSRAKEVLDLMKMDAAERASYERYMEQVRHTQSVVGTNFTAGRLKGLEEGKQLGLEEGKQLGMEEGRKAGRELGIREMIGRMKERGLSPAAIAEMTGLSENEILNITGPAPLH